MIPALGNQRPRNAFRRSIRGDFFVPGTVLPAQATSKLASRQAFAHPSPAPPSHLRQTLDSGDGRLPKAPRVHACEAWPRAPHQPSGCPSGQLSLCPTSVTPLEAPLIGQDTVRISEVLRAGIGIHSQVRERRFADFCSLDGAQRNPGQSRHEDGIPDFAEFIIGRAFARPVGSIQATPPPYAAGTVACCIRWKRSTCWAVEVRSRS
jgi:hypothetical protein